MGTATSNGNGARSRLEVSRARTAVPRVPPRYVRRPRLLQMLDGATPDLLTVVCAPAGYGKTLLLADWVAQNPATTAWVSLDDDDHTDRGFWSAVLAAFAACAAVPEHSALRRLAVPRRPSDEPEFLPAVMGAIDALPVPVRLVVDDVHELTDAGPLHGLAALVRDRPPGLRVVLAGRTDPSLSLARRRLHGELCEIRARDLQFSTSEAGALLSAVGVSVRPDQVRLLVEQTDGWPVGLRLAALSLRETGDADRFLADLVGNSTATSDYLIGEILSQFAPDVRDLLHAVSICDQIPADLASALSGRPDAGEVLDALEHDTSLVLSAGEGRTWYRVHPLLRAHLRLDLQRRRPDLVDELHGRAADWFAARRRPVQALGHARHGADVARVAALTAQHAVRLVATGEHAALRTALDFLVEHGADGSPLLALGSALLAVESGSLVDADRSLARAETRWPLEPSVDLLVLRGLVRSRCAGLRGDPAEMIRTAEEFEVLSARTVPDSAQELAAMGQLDRALVLASAGRRGDARVLADAVVDDARRQGHRYLLARGLAVRGAVAGADGDYRAMTELAERADRELSDVERPSTAAQGLSSVLRAYGALLNAQPAQCLERIGPSPPADSTETELRGDGLHALRHALRGAALVDLGRPEAGVRELRAAHAAAVGRRAAAELVATIALLAHDSATSLGLHDLAREMQQWAEDGLGRTGDVLLMRARTDVTQGRHRVAGAALGPLLAGSVPAVVPWTVVEGRVLECRVALLDDRRPRARQALEQVLARSAAMGVLRPLTSGPTEVLDLLARQLGSFGAGDLTARRVLQIRRGAEVDLRAVSLTARERDVLDLLVTQRTMEEIAGELTMSHSTVKTHLRAIYRKLDVNSRRDAVAAARRRT